MYYEWSYISIFALSSSISFFFFWCLDAKWDSLPGEPCTCHRLAKCGLGVSREKRTEREWNREKERGTRECLRVRKKKRWKLWLVSLGKFGNIFIYKSVGRQLRPCPRCGWGERNCSGCRGESSRPEFWVKSQLKCWVWACFIGNSWVLARQRQD